MFPKRFMTVSQRGHEICLFKYACYISSVNLESTTTVVESFIKIE